MQGANLVKTQKHAAGNTPTKSPSKEAQIPAEAAMNYQQIRGIFSALLLGPEFPEIKVRAQVFFGLSFRLA